MAENNPNLPVIADRRAYELRVRGVLLGQMTLNKFWYISDADVPPPGNLATLCSDFWDKLDVAWCAAVSADWALHSVIAQRLDTYGAASGFVTASTLAALALDVVGTTGDSCPPQDAVVMARKTNQIGKKARGRVYVGGLAEDDHTSGLLIAGAQTRFGTLAAAMLGNVVSQGITFVPHMVHWKHTPPDTVELRGLPITAWVTDPIVRSQRRRQISHGV